MHREGAGAGPGQDPALSTVYTRAGGARWPRPRLADTLRTVVSATPAARRTLVDRGRLCAARPAGTWSASAATGWASGWPTRSLTPRRRTVDPAGRHGHAAAHPGPAGRWSPHGLDRADAVLGPAEDGGWWALALRDPAAARVLRRACRCPRRTPVRCTAAALRGLRPDCRCGPLLRDVDTAADAHAVAAACPGPGSPPPSPGTGRPVCRRSAPGRRRDRAAGAVRAALRRAAGGRSAALDLVRSSAARPGEPARRRRTGRDGCAPATRRCSSAAAAPPWTSAAGRGGSPPRCARRGHDALGVDISAEAVRQARRRGARRHARVTSSGRCRCEGGWRSGPARGRQHRHRRGPGPAAAALRRAARTGGGWSWSRSSRRGCAAGRPGRAAPGRPDQRGVPVGAASARTTWPTWPAGGPAGAGDVDGGGPVVRPPRSPSRLTGLLRRPLPAPPDVAAARDRCAAGRSPPGSARPG